MAMNNMMSKTQAPGTPSMSTATRAGVRPEPESPSVIWDAPLTRSRFVVNARPTSPCVVPIIIGTANQTTPPKMYPEAALSGFTAIADCQYDWSTKTVPKLPTMFTMPKTNPECESMVARLGTQRSPFAPSHPCCTQCSFSLVVMHPSSMLPHACTSNEFSLHLSWQKSSISGRALYQQVVSDSFMSLS